MRGGTESAARIPEPQERASGSQGMCMCICDNAYVELNTVM